MGITFSAVSEAAAVLDVDPVAPPAESGSDFTFAADDSADTAEVAVPAADDVDAADAVEAMASADDIWADLRLT